MNCCLLDRYGRASGRCGAAIPAAKDCVAPGSGAALAAAIPVAAAVEAVSNRAAAATQQLQPCSAVAQRHGDVVGPSSRIFCGWLMMMLQASANAWLGLDCFVCFWSRSVGGTVGRCKELQPKQHSVKQTIIETQPGMITASRCVQCYCWARTIHIRSLITTTCFAVLYHFRNANAAIDARISL